MTRPRTRGRGVSCCEPYSRKAIISVFLRASSISRSSKSFSYQRRLNPPNTVRLAVSVSLKEKTISTKIGAYKKRNIKKV